MIDDLGTALVLGLVAHLLGDYVIQSHWMACEKTKRWWPAICHAASYTVPFTVLTLDPVALAVIGGTHLVIDRYRLARHLCFAKNWLLAPAAHRPQWSTASGTGYDPDRSPAGMAIALMIVADNTIHIAINCGALTLAV